MDAFVSRKRRRISGPKELPPPISRPTGVNANPAEEESTDFKLAVLASLHPDLNGETLLEALLVSDGSVEQASRSLTQTWNPSPRKKAATSTIGYQSSLSSYRIASPQNTSPKKKLTRRGKTLFLYSPEDVETNTPCSIIHNFLPPEEADALLLELLEQAPTYNDLEFQLFERTVRSPHTFCFYVNDLESAEKQKTEYIYDGRRVDVSSLQFLYN
jgi:hypothetical protein